MLTLLIMKEKEKEKININKILKYLCYFKKLVIEIILGYSRKKFKQRGLSIYFLSEISPPTLDFLDLLLHPQKFQRKQAFNSTNSGKLCGTPWKFQVIFITRMAVFLLLSLENEFLQAFSTIIADNNEEFTIKHGEKILCEVCGRFF